MKDVAKHTRLTRRSTGIYYFRCRVPTDLLEGYAPKKEIMFSLGTKDHREALEKVKVASLKQDQEFAEARRLRDAEQVEELSDAEIDRLIALQEYKALEAQERLQFDGLAGTDFLPGTHQPNPHGGHSESELAELRRLNELILTERKEQLAKGHWKKQAGYVNSLLKEHGIKLKAGSQSLRKLCQHSLEMSIKVIERQADRLEGIPVELPPEPPPPHSGLIPNTARAEDPPLSIVFEKYSSEKLAAGSPQKTIQDFGAAIRQFNELHGDLPVSSFFFGIPYATSQF